MNINNDKRIKDLETALEIAYANFEQIFKHPMSNTSKALELPISHLAYLAGVRIKEAIPNGIIRDSNGEPKLYHGDNLSPAVRTFEEV